MQRRLFNCLLTAGLLLAAAAHAAPTQVSANAGEVRDLLYTTGSAATATVYAATLGGGVFKSTTSGATWSHLPGLPARYVYRLAVSPLSVARIYAATESGLWRSPDSGATWAQLSFDPTTAVAVDPGSAVNDTVMIGVPGVGIVLVTNASSSPTFTRASTNLDSTDVLKIEYQENSTAVAALACNYQDMTPPYKEGNYGGVFRTTNNGGAWTALPQLSFNLSGVATPTKCVSDVATNLNTIVATSYDALYNQGFVQQSVSPYSSWSSVTPGNPNTGDLFGATSVKRDRNTSTTFWAGSAQVGVWKSTTSGVSWTQQTANAAANSFTGINALETIAGGTNVIAGIRGLGISTAPNADNVQTWTLATGLTADRVRSLTNHATAAPNTYYMALEKGGVQKSADAGANWLPLNTGLEVVYNFPTQDHVRSAQAIAADPSNTTIVAVGVRSYGLYTLSGGTTWTGVGNGVAGSFTGPTDHKPQSLAITSAGSTYYTLFDSGSATPGGLFSGSSPSTMGSTGRPIFESNLGLGIAPGSYRVVISPNSNLRVYFLMYDSEPYRSTDGVNFSRVTVPNQGFLRIAFFDIAERPGNPNVVVGATNKGIFRSADGGANFARISASGLTELGLSSIAYAGDGKLFGGTLSGGFYCSKDDGSSWQTVPLGPLPAVPVREVRFMNGKIHWLTDGGGIYKSDSATDCP